MHDVLDVSMVPGDYRRWLLRVIPQVIDEARRSLCAKDRRGAGVWHHNYDCLSLGNNSPPEPFRCDGSDACKAACGKLAVHAEERALLRSVLRTCHSLDSDPATTRSRCGFVLEQNSIDPIDRYEPSCASGETPDRRAATSNTPRPEPLSAIFHLRPHVRSGRRARRVGCTHRGRRRRGRRACVARGGPGPIRVVRAGRVPGLTPRPGAP